MVLLLIHSGLKYISIFDQKLLPIRTTHHTFLKSKQPAVTKNLFYVLSTRQSQIPIFLVPSSGTLYYEVIILYYIYVIIYYIVLFYIICCMDLVIPLPDGVCWTTYLGCTDTPALRASKSSFIFKTFYIKIWKKIEGLMRINFDSEPVYGNHDK